MTEHDGQEIWKGAVAGLAGGLAASWVMNYAHQAWGKAEELIEAEIEGEDEAGNDVETAKEGEDPTTVKAASAISEGVFHHRLSESEKPIAGQLMHYSFGTATGAVYGTMAELVPATARGFGLPFGAVVWLGADEVAVPLAGLSGGLADSPPTAHGRALFAHLVYGLTAELVRRAVRAAL